MSILPHVIVGASAGSFLPNPIAAGVAGFLSHFILDYIPHWDPPVVPKKPLWKSIAYPILLIVDIGLSVLFLIFLAKQPNMFWGGLAGGLVDLDNIFHFLKGMGIKIHDGGSKWHHKTTFLTGISMQAIVTLLGLLFIISHL